MEANENHALTKAESCYHCKPLVQQRNELAAQVERLRGALSEIERLPGCRQDECGIIASEVLSEQPPAALAALKAQWQAEALIETAGEFMQHERARFVLNWKAGELIKRAQEAGDE